jgi:hypothetical protein
MNYGFTYLVSKYSMRLFKQEHVGEVKLSTLPGEDCHARNDIENICHCEAVLFRRSNLQLAKMVLLSLYKP